MRFLPIITVSLFASTGAVLAQDLKCADCHERQAKDHAGSIHDSRGISCESCHGTDQFDVRKKMPHKRTGAFQGRPDDLPTFCGKCHSAEAEFFRAGGHFDRISRQEAGAPRLMKNCVVCHAYHRTEPAAFSAIGDRCLACHPAGSSHFGSIALFEAGLSRTRGAADALEAHLKALGVVPGLSDRPGRESLDEARTSLVLLRQRQHGVRYAEFGPEADRAVDRARGADGDLSDQERSKRRRLPWLLAFLFVMGLNLALLRRWFILTYGEGKP